MSSFTSLLGTGVPEKSPGAFGMTMGVIVMEPVTSASFGGNRADAAVNRGPTLGTPVSPPSLTENTCRDLDTSGVLCGSPANPPSISRSALGFPVQIALWGYARPASNCKQQR
ncbi:hypothetical protein WJX79_011101 [Trebouxia sp. C0005]